MDPSTVAFIKGVIAFLMVSGTGMAGCWLWFRLRATYRADRTTEMDALRDEHTRLEAELGGRMAELEERVDFVERRLVQERPPAQRFQALAEPPKATTPV